MAKLNGRNRWQNLMVIIRFQEVPWWDDQGDEALTIMAKLNGNLNVKSQWQSLIAKFDGKTKWRK